MKYNFKTWYIPILILIIAFSILFTFLGNFFQISLFVNLAKTFFIVAVGLVALLLFQFLIQVFKKLWRHKIIKILVLVLILIPILVIGSFFFFAALQEKIVHEGDLILSGDQVMVIDNKRFIVTGEVVIQDRAVLKLTNRAYLEVKWSPDKPSELLVKDNGQLIVEGSTIKGGGIGGANIRGQGIVYLTRVSWWAPVNVWFNLGDSSKLISKDSFVPATIGDQATIEMDGGSSFIELIFPKGITAQLSLPKGRISSWSFLENGVLNSSEQLGFNIIAKNAKFNKWGMTLPSAGDFTFVDSPALVIGFTLNEPRDKPIILTDLKKRGYYENKIFQLGSKTTLTLLNSSIAGNWYFGTLGETNLTIKNSELADPVGIQDSSIVTFENSVIDFLGATDEATVYVKNSKVNEWARAGGEAKIFFENPKKLPRIFPGQPLRLYEIDNGQIFIDGEPFEK